MVHSRQISGRVGGARGRRGEVRKILTARRGNFSDLQGTSRPVPAGAGMGAAARWYHRALGEDQRERASMNGNAGGVVSTRVLTVPNLISFARLCLLPVFLGLYPAGRDL